MLKKILFKPGVNRENTRYTNEGGWYSCDKVRFRQGTPEKIGGWQRISTETYQGVCRSLWAWSAQSGDDLIGVGTNLKFYISTGGFYYDITPYRTGVISLTNAFTTNGTTTVVVNDTAHGAITGDFVHITNVSGAVNGIPAASLQGEFQITKIDDNSYSIVSPVTATSSGTPAVNCDVQYEINTGAEIQVAQTGWGAGGWGLGGWGQGLSVSSLRLWSQSNVPASTATYQNQLVFSPGGGEIYYWDGTSLSSRGVLLSSVSGASDVPTASSFILVSDINRFLFAIGCTDYGSSDLDPMLIRWSNIDDIFNWTPSATTQAGSLRLSRGSKLIAGLQARQEILLWSDSALYSLQYLGGQEIWGAQLVGENISIVSQNAVAYASDVAYWMGVDKFYFYNGRTQTLVCDLRQYIFSDINRDQLQQVVAGTNEGFNEIWWFYCSAGSEVVDRYVVFNYAERNASGGLGVWYYGNLSRTAWLDMGILNYPIAATYSNNIVEHENGLDDNATSTTLPITASITSAEFDVDDGDKFMFIRRVLPDLTFRGSTANSPSGTMTFYPLKNSGSGYTDPASVGGSNLATSTRTATVPIEQFAGQLYVRLRARQMAVKFETSSLGTTWQLGAMRLDIQADGAASGSGVSGG